MCVRSCDVTACDLDAAPARLAEAGEGLDELALAVPVDTGDRDDLPRPHVERDAAHGFEVSVVKYLQVLDAEEGLAGIDRRLLDPEQDFAADHQARKSLGSRTFAGNRVDLLAASEDGDAFGDLEHLTEFVTDEDDRHALALERPQDCEELVRFLGSQDSGGLVEDEDV